MGANDYLAKPFDFMELEARVRSLARRDFIQKNSIISIQEITIDTSQKIVTVHDMALALAPKEYAILEYLAMNCGRIISSEELIDHIWESDVDMFMASVKVHISNIRKKLHAACGKEMIKTIRGCGYMIKETRRYENE